MATVLSTEDPRNHRSSCSGEEDFIDLSLENQPETIIGMCTIPNHGIDGLFQSRAHYLQGFVISRLSINPDENWSLKTVTKIESKNVTQHESSIIGEISQQMEYPLVSFFSVKMGGALISFKS